MRLILKIKILSKDSKLAVNYNYPLSAAIYKILKLGSKEFADFLHNIGFKSAGKTYKLFTFALRFDKFKIVKQEINLLQPNLSLIISSPLIDTFIKDFVIGSFTEQKIEIVSEAIKTIFLIEQIESLPDIQFRDNTKFVMLSPTILSTKLNNDGRLQQYYYRYNDPLVEINRVINKNLINKYELIYNTGYSNSGVNISWNKNYIKRMEEKKKRITKKITIPKANLKIELIGNQLPFEIEGDPELIKVGYECRFGEKNSLGFGCVNPAKV